MPKIVKPLSDAEIRRAKPKDKDYKLPDGMGLSVLVDTKGNKYWRFNYPKPYTKKRSTLGWGSYPDVTLADAREKREIALKLLEQNIDPVDYKKTEADSNSELAKNTFKHIALEWLDRQDNYADATRAKSLYLLECAFALIGDKPIAKITPLEVLSVCRVEEQKGLLEKASKIKSKCAQVFRYAVATGRCERDPTVDLRGALKTPKTKHHAAVIEPERVGELLKDIDHYKGHMITQAALKIAPLTFVRPGELRSAKWSDIDLDKKLWTYTPRKTQNSTAIDHMVPLSDQAVAVLADLKTLTGQSEYVFPSTFSFQKCMSENTVNLALRRMGWSGEEMCGHGFRAMARTILEEVLEYPIEIIEQQLAHRVKDVHGRAYNRTKHLAKRTEMLQRWADYLDELKQKSI